MHGRDASSHEIWCWYLYPIRSYWYFSEIKDGGCRHLGFVWVSRGTTHETSFVARTSCNNFVMIGSVVFKLQGFEFFFVQAWKSYSRPQNFSFWGILPPKFRGTSFRLPNGTSLSGTTHFEPSLVQIRRTVRPVALAKKPKKRKKKDGGKLAICPDHPRRRAEVKLCMPGGLRCVVLLLYFKFY